VGEFNSGQNVNAQQDSISNALAQAGFKVNAAGQLVADNNAALGTAATQGGILGAVGDAQQQQQQGELDRAYQNYMNGIQLTLAQQQLLNSALGLVPAQQTISSNGTNTTKESGGLGGILGGALSLGTGILGLGTDSIGGSIFGNLFGGGPMSGISNVASTPMNSYFSK
jgi:hypothetical protein